MDWYKIPLNDLLVKFNVDPAKGLTENETMQRLSRYGYNKLAESKKESEIKKFLLQFANPLVITLLIAAIIASGVAVGQYHPNLSIRHFTDSIAILLIVIINAILGYIQEHKAEKALEAISKLAAPTARVLRDGVSTIIPADTLVPGDIIILEPGDKIPADLRLTKVHNLAVDESALTGESTPVNKKVIDVDKDLTLADRVNMIFLGTVVVRGRGEGIAVQTGMDTAVGRISMILEKKDSKKTPLEERLAHFGKRVLIGTLIISAIVFIIGLIDGRESISMLFLIAVSLAVAVIPEGLPAITTITLALGMQRMAKSGAIVRKLSAVETLGCATVICSDKTGTLTLNEMNIQEVFLAGNHIKIKNEPHELNQLKENELLKLLLKTGIIASSAELKDDRVVGDPTEGAILLLANKLGIIPADIKNNYKIEKEIPFSSERRMMSVEATDNKTYSFVKGAVEVILKRCTKIQWKDGIVPLSDELKEEIEKITSKMAESALRVLAIAMKTIETVGENSEENLELIGLIGIMDPPRPEVKEAVTQCHKAGIRVVMITGDHLKTAEAIAKKIGIWKNNSISINGEELEKKDDTELDILLDNVAVFARVTAEQKLRIVKAFMRRKEVVAVTGDGVNDAPALKESDIGIAMGKRGTDVAREASDMILVDDNFSTIVKAIREGRAIFANIQKFIFFLLSSNAALCVAILAAYILNWPPVLTPLMILWINLVTNGLPALALGIDTADPQQMNHKPRNTNSKLLSASHYLGILCVGIVMAILALIYYYYVGAYENTETYKLGQVGVFMILAFGPLFHAFNCRSDRSSIFKIGLFSNKYLWFAIIVSGFIQLLTIIIPPLRPIFKTDINIVFNDIVIFMILSFLMIPLGEIYKLFIRLIKAK